MVDGDGRDALERQIEVYIEHWARDDSIFGDSPPVTR